MGRKKGDINKHKKQKPIKEKKQRGRPKGSIKQKQHQDQHQIVNVNINTKKGKSSDDEKEVKKKKNNNSFQNMIPNIVFNPSIAIPQGAPINRQETNPPYYDMNSLMQPIQQAIQQPIRTQPPQLVQQVQPVQPKPTTSKEKIKAEIQQSNANDGINNDAYVPNPQTDQSHPLITPDLVIDSNITTPTHDKHMQHKFKERAKELYDQAITNKKEKPKFNDTEGLGARIPIQNIGAIAGTIASGGIYGGSVAAGEALLTGGLTGLAASGETILGSTIGGGIAAVGDSLLGGPAGHIISGIAGGVVGRSVVNRARGRPRADTEPFTGRGNVLGSEGEQHPLLGGNRLGGRQGRNRLVPQTGEGTQWIVPEEATTMERIMRGAKRTTNDIVDNVKQQAAAIGDTANEAFNHVRQRITGRNTNPSKGTYAIIPKDDIKIQQKKFERNLQQALGVEEQPFISKSTTFNNNVARLNEPITGPNIRTMDDVYDDIIQQEQKQLQRKYKEQLKGGYTNPDIENLSHLTESAAHWEANPLSRSKKWARLKENEGMQAARNDTANRVLNIIGEENAIRANAASKIKAAIKSKNESKTMLNKTKAATTVQKVVRGIAGRKAAKSERIEQRLGALVNRVNNENRQTTRQVMAHSMNKRIGIINNLGKLTHGLQREQHQQRLGAAAIRPTDILGVSGTTRTGAKFGATEVQLNAPSRMQLHRERNPELTQLRQQISDNARGKLQLTDVQKAGIKTRIEQLVEINKALKAKGTGPKLGRPKGT